MKQPIHLPGLNGIRAIASLGVLVSHTTLAMASFGIPLAAFGKFANGMDLAGFGVSMFFSLSGFLITYLLLREKEETQRVDTRSFYVRRVLRIWPLYYLYLFVCLSYAWATGTMENQEQLPFYLLLAANVPFIFSKLLPMVGHYWSLGVEEQFYLFWPWMARLPRKRLYWATIGLTVLLVATKVVVRFTVPNFDSSLIYRTIHVTRFHCMLFGALGSMLYYDRNRLFMAVTTHKSTQLLAWLVVALIIVNRFHVASFIDGELVSIITVLLIMGQITQRNNIINLEKPFFNFFGKISYGVYVIHPLLIVVLARIIGPLSLPIVAKATLIYGSVLASTTLLAYLSFNYFEKPFLRIKQRFMVVHSSPTAQKVMT
jgi:peptidoglycan/LPS O-acetylase OafA/YrhL